MLHDTQAPHTAPIPGTGSSVPAPPKAPALRRAPASCCGAAVLSIVAAALIAQVGCGVEGDLLAPPVASVQRDCTVRVANAEAAGPVSLEYPGGSLWIWASLQWTPPEGGDALQMRNVAAWVSDTDETCRGELPLIGAEQGQPAVVLPLLQEELDDNASRQDGRRWALEPLGGPVHQGVGYLYYERRLLGPGIFDVHSVGVGLCVFDTPGHPCRRLETGPNADDPTLLFEGGPSWRSLSAAVEDDTAYLVVCTHAAAFNDPCVLSRVPVPALHDPVAYSWANWGADDGWTSDRFNGVALLDSAGQVTLRRSPTLDAWQLVVTDIWTSRVTLWLAQDVTGPYEQEGTLFDAEQPHDWFVIGGREHASLGSPDGSTIVVSYSSDPDGAGQQLHLVTLRLDARPR